MIRLLLLSLLFSASISAAPKTPEIKKLTQSNNHRVTVGWTAVNDAAEYSVYRNDQLVKIYRNSTEFVDTDIVELSTYRYSIMACDVNDRCSKPSPARFIVYTAGHGKLTSKPAPRVEVDYSQSVPTNVYFSTSAGAVFLRWTPHKDAVKTKIYMNGIHVHTATNTNPIYQVFNANSSDSYHLVSVFKDGGTSNDSVSIKGP